MKEMFTHSGRFGFTAIFGQWSLYWRFPLFSAYVLCTEDLAGNSDFNPQTFKPHLTNCQHIMQRTAAL